MLFFVDLEKRPQCYFFFFFFFICSKVISISSYDVIGIILSFLQLVCLLFENGTDHSVRKTRNWESSEGVSFSRAAMSIFLLGFYVFSGQSSTGENE
jgi:hypothetical protein